MKNITLTLGLLSILGLNAAAHDDPAPGDRVEITFASEGTIVGIVVKPATPPREPSLTLDLAAEYPGLIGTLTIPMKDIKAIRKVRAPLVVNEPWVCDLGNRQKAAAPAKPAPTMAPSETPKAAPAPDENARKAEEELKKAREMFAKFPPPDWSPERRNAIRLKQYRGQFPTPAEREFEQGFDLWEKGRAAASNK